jgi:hypothetical protein
MTTRPDDDQVPRDPRFDAAWRAASNEEPAPALDAAILAAAHRAAGAKPQSLSAQAMMRARRRWWPLAAAATVAVIAIGVVQRAGHDDLVTPPSGSAVVSDMPAQPAKSVAEPNKLASEATLPTARPAAAMGGSSNSAEGRPQADSVSGQSARGEQPAGGRSGMRTDAERRDVAGAAPSLQKKAQAVSSEAAPSERKSEAAANAMGSLPEPFPAATPKSDAAAVRDARAAASGSASTGNIPSAQRQEAAAAKPAASAIPVAPAPTPSAATPTPAATAPMPAATAPMPPTASFADGARVAAPAIAPSSPAARTAMSGAAAEARPKDRAPLLVADWIALIRRLRDEGNVAEAARELAAFRTAHADHEKLLPSDLRDWHPPEK